MARLTIQLGYDSTASQIAEQIVVMKQSGDYTVFVAQLMSGAIAGWIGVCVLRTVETNPWTEVTGLIVDETLRSQGIGKALLDQAEQWTRTRGCDVVTVHSNVVRERAHRFYEANGYDHVKTQKCLQKHL
jgi:GNAT superfamily N-acetyltransferase